VRNILRHRTKTLIIGVLITIGITVLVVGNSLMDTASRGIEKTYVERYTGHIVITGKSERFLSLMGLEDAETLDEPLPTIPSLHEVLAYVPAQPFVRQVNPQATVMAL